VPNLATPPSNWTLARLVACHIGAQTALMAGLSHGCLMAGVVPVMWFNLGYGEKSRELFACAAGTGW